MYEPIVSKRRPSGSGKRLALNLVVLIPLFLLLVNIITPQFGKGCDNTHVKSSSIKSILQTVRSQLQLYHTQHHFQYPPSGRMIECLTKCTTEDHRICSIDTIGRKGPYLLNIPHNPYNRLSTIEIANDESGLGDGSHGWHFNKTTGEFNIDWIPESEKNHFDCYSNQ